MVKSYLGLLTLGKSDFEAIEAYRRDRFFQEALGIRQVPGSVWLRQQLGAHAAAIREHTDEWSVRLIRRSGAPITADDGFVCLDFDTFVMANGGTRKECVSRTYQGVDGYTPIAAYLGNEGWCVGLELRPGSQHSALETHYFLERVLPRVYELMPPEQAVLSRSDSGFDSARLLFQQDDASKTWTAAGRTFAYLVKWNPRRQDRSDWAARAEAAGAFKETRPGKRVALLDLTVERAWQKEKRDFRRVVRLTERTIDRHGQHLLLPAYTLEGWWTNLSRRPRRRSSPATPGTAPTSNSTWEIKSDLDLERLPSGKFDCNDLILHLGMFAYNCLRLIGQGGLTGELAKVAPPGETPPAQDRVAGTHVPGRPVHSQSPAADSRFRPELPGRRRLRGASGRLAGGGPIAMRTAAGTGVFCQGSCWRVLRIPLPKQPEQPRHRLTLPGETVFSGHFSS
ncbi:MAG: IS1380 family transposase [Pseudomonadota bacterium]